MCIISYMHISPKKQNRIIQQIKRSFKTEARQWTPYQMLPNFTRQGHHHTPASKTVVLYSDAVTSLKIHATVVLAPSDITAAVFVSADE